jgi:FMN reductase
MQDRRSQPLIVGLGGTMRTPSSCEHAVRLVLSRAAAGGARTAMFDGQALQLPLYDPDSTVRIEKAERLLAALREADGVIIASPGYHGSVSGLVKNALDYTEAMKSNAPPYFEGKAVGLICCAGGWQATGTTLAALRSIVHALRGWPTPLGVAINTSVPVFLPDGTCLDAEVAEKLDLLAMQLVQFTSRARAFGGAGRARVVEPVS